MRLLTCSLLLGLLHAATLRGQPPDAGIFGSYADKATKLQGRITKETEKALKRIGIFEQRLQRKLLREQVAISKDMHADLNKRYAILKATLADTMGTITPLHQQYIPLLDSVKVALDFRKQLSNRENLPHLEQWNNELNKLQQTFTQSSNISDMLNQQVDKLEQQLGKLKALAAFNKYKSAIGKYQIRLNQFRAMAMEPDKALAAGLNRLRQLPAFQAFFRKHSLLAALIPPDPTTQGNLDPSLAGLQSRWRVRQAVFERLGSSTNATSLLRQQVDMAQGQIQALKAKVTALQQRGLPPDVKGSPNPESKHSFWKRLQVGTNLQSSRRGAFTPIATDLGLSIGYKINPKSIIGIGGSYRLGWGKDLRRITISHEGIGIRSFVDWKIKGTLYCSGGYELNYQPIEGINGIRPPAAWTPSGLLGLSKMVPSSNRILKQTKLQLLFDLLAYQQTPRTSLLKFRLGYNF
jgi:hypothetical protein